MEILELKNVCKNYGAERVLDNINLSFEKGAIVGLLGPNGSGKTTIIKLLNGLIPLSSGEIMIDGRFVGVETKKIISYLPERTYLDVDMSPMDYIKYFKDFYADFDDEKAYRLCSSLQIDIKKKLRVLSKGTREKVQLILVMSRRAKIFILDEPIAGVDPAGRDFILNTILSNVDDNSTILISTHLISDVQNILDDVVFLQNGHVVLHKKSSDIYQDSSIDQLFREVFKCF